MRNFIGNYIYLMLFVYLVIGASICKCQKKAKQKYVVSIFFIFYYVLFVFRDYSVGFDYKNYVIVFDYAKKLGLGDLLKRCSYMEPGYLAINKIIAFLFGNIQILQLVLCTIFIYALYCFIKWVGSKGYNELLLVFIFYGLGVFFNCMNQTRSTIGAALYLVAYVYAHEKKWVKALVVSLVACTIHMSAIIGILVIMIEYLKPIFTKQWIFRIFVIDIAAYLVFPVLIDFGLMIFPRYRVYFASDKQEIFIKNGSVMYLLLFTAIFIYAYSRRKYVIEKGHQIGGVYDTFLWINCIGIIVSTLVMKISMMQRFMIIPLFFMPALIVMAVSANRNARSRLLEIMIIVCAIIAFAIIYLYYSENGMGRDGIVPYTFVQW